MRAFTVIASILFFCLLTGPTASAQEWTRFRGPNGTGIGEATTIPAEWSEADYNWKVKLPGLGHSSPVVWGERVFLLSADPDDATRHVLCYSAADGSRLWRRDFKSAGHHLHARSSYASCTPAVDDERVYVGWSTPEEITFKAFDHNGEEVWSLDLGTWTSMHGFGTSPIVHGEKVILHLSQQAVQLKEGDIPGKSFMLAFDRRTGEEIWRRPLISKQVCYSVPFIFQPADGPPELVCTSTGNGVFSLDPESGQENWALRDAFAMRTVSSPIAAGGLIFGSTGSGAYSGNYVAAVRPGKQADLAYSLKNSGKFKAPYVPCLLQKGEDVFLIYDRGFAGCIEASSGKIRWMKRTEGAFNGSPVRVGDKIFCIDEDGVVWVIAADPSEYRLLAKNELGEPSRATPAVSGGKMFLRTLSQLICVGGRQSVAAAR